MTRDVRLPRALDRRPPPRLGPWTSPGQPDPRRDPAPDHGLQHRGRRRERRPRQGRRSHPGRRSRHRRPRGGSHQRGPDRPGPRLGVPGRTEARSSLAIRSSNRPMASACTCSSRSGPGVSWPSRASTRRPNRTGRHSRARVASEAEVIELERRIRLPKLEAHLRVLPEFAAAGSPVFLLGDFNAPSHLDWTTETVDLRWHVRRPIDWPMSRAIEAAGFRDAWRDIHPDPVAEPGLTWWASRPPTGGYEPGPETPNDRIDLLYAAGPAATRDCVIVGEGSAPDVGIVIDPWPSDHRAVVATFDVVAAPRPDALEAAPERPDRRDPDAHRGPRHVPRRRRDRRDLGGRAGLPVGLDRRLRGTRRRRPRRAPGLAAHRCARRWHGPARRRCCDRGPVVRGGRWPLPPGDYVAAYLLDDGQCAVARAPFRVEP